MTRSDSTTKRRQFRTNTVATDFRLHRILCRNLKSPGRRGKTKKEDLAYIREKIRELEGRVRDADVQREAIEADGDLNSASGTVKLEESSEHDTPRDEEKRGVLDEVPAHFLEVIDFHHEPESLNVKRESDSAGLDDSKDELKERTDAQKHPATVIIKREATP